MKDLDPKVREMIEDCFREVVVLAHRISEYYEKELTESVWCSECGGEMERAPKVLTDGEILIVLRAPTTNDKDACDAIRKLFRDAMQNEVREAFEAARRGTFYYGGDTPAHLKWVWPTFADYLNSRKEE